MSSESDRRDRDEITDLLARYGSLLDRGDHEAWVDLFTAEGSFEVFGRSFQGRQGLMRMAETAPGGVHMAGLPVIELDDDTARVQQSFVFFDQHTHEVRIGWYDDVVQREGEGWRFEKRRSTFLTPDGPSDRP
jgi:3-phenylpropionate/cinnamic acid dioxygenase small subunit